MSNQHNLKRAQTIAQYLAKAERPVRILRTVAWPASVRREFFKHKAQKLPRVNYIPYNGQVSIDYLQKARALLPKNADQQSSDPVTAWLSRIADRLERANAMLEAIGTADFYTHSKQLYAPPKAPLLDGKTTSLDLARHMDETLSGLSHDKLVGHKPVPLDAPEFAKQLSAKLHPYFGAQTPEVIVASNLSAKALAGSRRIRISADATFTQIDIRQLLHHEALVHAATALNGRAQTIFPILGAAHAGTTQIQEGLAVFAEIISGAMDPVRFRRLVDRVIAIDMAIEGADFIEVYRYFFSRNPDDGQARNVQAFEDTRRVFRGGVIKGGAPFTKDGVYLNGLLRVHNFLRTVTKLGRADLIRLLFVGKLDLEDIPAMAVLADQGALLAPQIVPPWISDMRFLVSYLAYSSFLNQVELPGFQTYYQNMVADVPDVWHFGDPK